MCGGGDEISVGSSSSRSYSIECSLSMVVIIGTVWTEFSGFGGCGRSGDGRIII